MSSSLLISVEGNVGAGKSTLLRRVAELAAGDPSAFAHVAVVQEPVEAWVEPVLPGGLSMLDAYYADRAGNALAFQMFAMLTRERQLEEVVASSSSFARCLGPRVVIAERSPASAFELFGRPMRAAGLLNDAEWHAYSAWNDWGKRTSAIRHAGVAYLRVDPGTCAERIEKRARAAEAGGKVDAGYLEMLHASHEAFVGDGGRRGDGVEVLRLGGLDVDRDAADLLEMARRLGSAEEGEMEIARTQ